MGETIYEEWKDVEKVGRYGVGKYDGFIKPEGEKKYKPFKGWILYEIERKCEGCGEERLTHIWRGQWLCMECIMAEIEEIEI